MNVFKSSCESKAVIVLKNVDMIRKYSRAPWGKKTERCPVIEVHFTGYKDEIILNFNVGEEYTRDQEFYVLTKALEEYHA